jgi:hypothetical protein
VRDDLDGLMFRPRLPCERVCVFRGQSSHSSV